MRRVIILSMMAFGLIVVSCQKADINPSAGVLSAPQWENEKSNDDLSGDELEAGKPDNNQEAVRITDPNEDPDSNPNGNPNTGND